MTANTQARVQRAERHREAASHFARFGEWSLVHCVPVFVGVRPVTPVKEPTP